DEACALLKRLEPLTRADATLVLQLENGASLSTIERIIEADLSESLIAGVADVRTQSPASVYKLLMDAGWMPTLAGRRDAEPRSAGIAAAALSIAELLDIPRGTAQRTLTIDQFVICAKRPFAAALTSATVANFTVVVPTTRERQLRLNIEQSPGLREVDARIVSCRHAHDASEALQKALPSCDADWVLLCHQDVYFPAGFGLRLQALLASIPPADRPRALIGFVGMGVNTGTRSYEPAGFVIDRLHAADHPASDKAVSIDELAIVIARDSIHRIDPALGWHLWGTDLCLTAICEHQVFPQIVRLPLFHNSVTDYQLPPAFFDAAALLARKHASFGPIPTLCGTIDDAFLAKHGRPAPHTAAVEHAAPAAPAAATVAADSTGIALVLQPATSEVEALIAADRFDDATSAIYRFVHLSYTQDGIKHRALYYPEFDRQVLTLAQALGAEPGQKRNGAPGVPLLIATELYDLGGHSRVLEEVSREMARPVLVLTDLFRNYHRNPALLEQVKQRFAHTQVIVLPDVPLWEKCRMLRTLDLHLVPRSTLYFGHHQDPIPFIGTLSQPGRRRLFVHHGDHNPSLGCTLPGVHHVDLISSLQTLCSDQLGTATKRLPLYIADRGTKRFSEVQGVDYSVVTSGHPAKFARDGAVALQELVAAALSTVRGRFFHIGPIDDAWVAEIRAHLGKLGLDASRFVALGLVPSVWDTLKDIDAAVYIGSAPVSGGRAAIEAQGCGYPVLCFNGFAPGSLLADYSSYADPGLGWSDPRQLAQLLGRVGQDHAALSRQARAFYEAEFSRTRFRKVLKGLLGH
ncbi:MAG: hypothetical protein K2Q07_07000, partial [Burkholderiaceae bacterium]|nr:hypothetical protein [Burkholderiaceae bacterium]